jgi:MAternally-affected-uncoordination protein
LLIDKKFSELHPLLAQVGPIIDNWQGSLQQKEYLKIFFLVLQVIFLFIFNKKTQET